MASATVVVCIDGLDPEYLEACPAPNLTALGKSGTFQIGVSMMPTVTNVNNVSMVTASYPETHGICSNYWAGPQGTDGTYLESGEHILAETVFQRARRLGRRTVLVTAKDKLCTLLGDGADVVVSSERPPRWVVQGIGPAPDIYSLEVNGWVIQAASYIMAQSDADLVYIATTDYAMHTYPPDAPESRRHISLLDKAIGQLVESHPDVTLLVTADHGMSQKTRMLDLKAVLGRYGIWANPAPVIKDRYVVHHSNLGGCIFVYLPPGDLAEALKVLRATPGVEDALPRDEAASRLRLHPDRIGDIVATAEVDVVFADPAEVDLPPNLRSHCSANELRVPIIGHGADVGNFTFSENLDLGRYVLERVLV